MRIFFNLSKFFTKKPLYKSQFEIDMAELVHKAEEAKQELLRESFNSDTLKTLCSPEFKPQRSGTLMAISTREPNKPVEVGYRRSQKGSVVSMDIFINGADKTPLGSKQYVLETDSSGTMRMGSGYMFSDEDACAKSGVKGIGILERILQIQEAVNKGINVIPCRSYARAVLFHLKTGFMPVPELTEIDSLYSFDKIMYSIKRASAFEIAPENYTPIIVHKDGKYYLDENTMQCIANLRQIKQNYENRPDSSVRPNIRGRVVLFNLEGKNFDTWKRYLKNNFSNLNVD